MNAKTWPFIKKRPLFLYQNLKGNYLKPFYLKIRINQEDKKEEAFG